MVINIYPLYGKNFVFNFFCPSVIYAKKFEKKTGMKQGMEDWLGKGGG